MKLKLTAEQIARLEAVDREFAQPFNQPGRLAAGLRYAYNLRKRAIIAGDDEPAIAHRPIETPAAATPAPPVDAQREDQ